MPTETQRADEQTPEAAGGCGAFPKHAENDSAKKRGNEEAEQGLNVIHDAVGLHHEIGGADTDENAEDGTPAAHADVVRIVGIFLDDGAVDIVSPDSGEGADVAGHA